MKDSAPLSSTASSTSTLLAISGLASCPIRGSRCSRSSPSCGARSSALAGDGSVVGAGPSRWYRSTALIARPKPTRGVLM